MISVPDLYMISKLFIQDNYPDDIHNILFNIIYGNQRDQYDYHKVFFNF